MGLVSASGQFSRFHTAALETRDVLLLGRSGGSCPVSGSFFLVLVVDLVRFLVVDLVMFMGKYKVASRGVRPRLRFLMRSGPIQ